MALRGIKFNVYYSTNPNGPWNLANSTPIERDEAGNTFTITGLKNRTIYYICVVGGVVVDNEFKPLMSQPIGPNPVGAGGIGVVPGRIIVAEAFTPQALDTASLGNSFRHFINTGA